MVYAPYNVLYHDYIIVLFSVWENTLDKSLFKGRCLPNIAEIMWIDLISKHTEITELTAPLLNELINKIVVHEATKDENGKRKQLLEIDYRFVGTID